MKPILIFRHWHSEGPGYLTDVLDRHQLPWRLIAIDAGDSVPEHLEDAASALVFMGGPMSVNDALDWVEQEVRLIRLAHAMGMPVLGHCLGGQLIAKALGGLITKNPVQEIGWLPVTQINSTATADWLGDLPPTFDVFHWHGETFAPLPAGVDWILSSRACAHQAFAVGNTLAMQCHIEMTAALVHAWTANDPPDIATPSATIQSAAVMTADLAMRIESLHRVADRIYGRWLQPLLA